jgi:hypothetical protein
MKGVSKQRLMAIRAQLEFAGIACNSELGPIAKCSSTRVSTKLCMTLVPFLTFRNKNETQKEGILRVQITCTENESPYNPTGRFISGT